MWLGWSSVQAAARTLLQPNLRIYHDARSPESLLILRGDDTVL